MIKYNYNWNNHAVQLRLDGNDWSVMVDNNEPFPFWGEDELRWQMAAEYGDDIVVSHTLSVWRSLDETLKLFGGIK